MLMKIYFILCWLLFLLLEVQTTTNAPISAPITSQFRSGSTILIANTQICKFIITLSVPLPSNNLRMALSFQQQHVNFNFIYGYNLWTYLYEISTSSTKLQFRAQLNGPIMNERARIKYLVCPFSTLSSNFQMLLIQFRNDNLSGTPSSQAYKYAAVATTLNTSGSYGYSTFIRSIDAKKYEGTQPFSFHVGFNPPNQIFMSTTSSMYIWTLRIQLIFFNQAVYSVSGNTFMNSISTQSTTAQGSFILSNYRLYSDQSYSICGLKRLNFNTNYSDWSFTMTRNELNYQTSMSWSGSDWGQIQCFVFTNLLCLSESPYYNFNGNVCVDDCYLSTNPKSNYTCNCSEGCVSCASPTSCQSCIPSYWMDNETCTSCPISCVTCTSQITCQSCSMSYYLRNDSFCYSNCLDSYYPQSSNRTCNHCPNYCLTCSFPTYCQKCMSSYYLTQNLTCNQCPANCKTCTSLKMCQSCSQDYSLGNDNLCHENSSKVGLIVGCVLGGVISVAIIITALVCINCERGRVHIAQRIIIQENNELSIDNIKVIDQECSICLQFNCEIFTMCKHNFHIVCLAAWSKKNRTCPNCRANLSTKKMHISCQRCRKIINSVTFLRLQMIQERASAMKAILCNGCQ